MSQSQVMCVLPLNVATHTKYCCVLVNQLKKDLSQLNAEAQRVHSLKDEYDKKLEVFIEVSKTVHTKLYHLWSIANQIVSVNYDKSMQLYDFANMMVEAWRDGDEMIAQDVQAVQLVSYTAPNVPLTFILDTIQNGVNLARETLQKISCHVNCMGQFTNLYGQITPLCTRLQDGNITLRYHLTVCKAIPYLRDLESVIDRFTNCNQGMITDSLAQESSTCGQNSQGEARNDTGEEDLSVFQNVVKLLTGELLGHEDCLDPHPTIRPIVSHQLPEIPKSAYINPYLSAYNAQTPVNYSSFWNDENMLNRIPFGYATPQLSGGYLSHYYPSTFHQYSNYNRNDYERTIISGNTVKNQVKETEISKNINGQELENDENRPQIINQNPNIGGNLRRDTNIGIQKKLPDKTLKQNNGNTVSVFVLNKTQCSVFQNASGNSKESIAKTRRTRLKRMTSSLRRNMTQNIRFLPNPPPEANDLPPIKIPTLKDNLLTPLS